MDLATGDTTTFGLQLILRIIFYWDIKVHNFFSNVQYFLTTLPTFVSTKWEFWTNMKTKLNTEQQQKNEFCFDQNANGDNKLSIGEIKMVMDDLGILCHDSDSDELGTADFSALFEEEPSLEEVKEAFDVFDQNKDGFVDATELQRVLCRLGLQEGSNVEQCRRMISAFDENGDGLIDFKEFVKLMEKCFC